MRYMLISFLLVSIVGVAQNKMTSEGEERTRISIKEKQNLVTKDIPVLLLEAWCKEEITAYYPKNQNVEMSYAQFLNHFGMEQRAYTVLDNQVPDWFCNEQQKCIPIDGYTMNCFQYEVELGEENYFNRQTSRNEKRIDYVKLIYSSICTARGIEVEGPVFKMKDIKRLDKQKYKVRNAQNNAASLPIWSYLTIGNFKRTFIYKKNDFVDNPARVDKKTLQKRINTEGGNWK